MLVLFVAWVRSGAAAQFQTGVMELAVCLSVDAVDPREFRDSQLLGAAGIVAETSGPISSAVVLAAQSTGDARMTRAAHTLADAVTRGESAATALRTIDRRTFLPMLRWVLATGQEQGSMTTALENLADVYRKRAPTRQTSCRSCCPRS